MTSKSSFRSKFFCGAAFGVLSLTGTAWAQDAEPTDDTEVVIAPIDEEEEEARQEQIVVTGSLLRRDEFSSTAPIQVITADVAALEGLVSSAEILQGSSIAAGSTQLNNQFGGFVVDGGTGVQTVDLRGCGGTRSLVLINGKRPGPSGTRGAVGAFDFNVIPSSVVSRYDILKDSGSTIYGSDAVCGVINVITRTQIDDPELNIQVTAPFQSGGESYLINGAYGLNFENGSIALAAEYSMTEELNIGDRDYLDCSQDLVRDPQTGQLRDRVNRSVTFDPNGDGRNCSNLYFNTVLDNVTGLRLIPSPDGREIGLPFGGLVPGYRPRENAGFGPNGPAFYEDVLEDPRVLSEDAINQTERVSFYAVADFDLNALGGVNSLTEFLYTNRETESDGWRQFFPQIRGLSDPFGTAFAYGQSPDFVNPLNTVYQPVTIWPSNGGAEVDYYYIAQTFSGDFGSGNFLENFAWQLNGNFSHSSGDYFRNQIIASGTGDWSQFGPNGQFQARRDNNGNVVFNSDGTVQASPIPGTGPAPTYDSTDPGFLAGVGPAYENAFNQLNGFETGNTVYEQYLINGNIAGSLFELPAGDVQAAVGFEYREFSIEDVPGALTLGELITFTDPIDGQQYQTNVSDIWGSSSAGITEGEDSVAEIFTEIEVPLLRGQPFAEELILNVSGRAFEYDSFGSDSVYKIGLNWQITPAVRMRATNGTSFRAPALFELFLEDQTGFVNQAQIDPCVNLADQTNQNIINNCLADGIPFDFVNLGSSAEIISGGGAGNLEAETSETTTVGLIFTPTFADLSVALDYYEIEIDDQIAQLGAGTILAGCYAADNFPNAFCDLFERAPADDTGAPFSILTVQDSYLNVNSQTFRGIDLEFLYEKEFNFGVLSVDGDMSWALERNQQLFAPGTILGFDQTDVNGQIGFPSMTGGLLVSLERNDFTYNWFTDYIGPASNERFADTPGGIEEAYFGTLVNVDYRAEAVFYHGLSLEYETDQWRFIAGVRNVFDEAPPQVSAEAATVRGNTPLVGTQYDLRGRRGFVQVTRTW